VAEGGDICRTRLRALKDVADCLLQSTCDIGSMAVRDMTCPVSEIRLRTVFRGGYIDSDIVLESGLVFTFGIACGRTTCLGRIDFFERLKLERGILIFVVRGGRYGHSCIE